MGPLFEDRLDTDEKCPRCGDWLQVVDAFYDDQWREEFLECPECGWNDRELENLRELD